MDDMILKWVIGIVLPFAVIEIYAFLLKRYRISSPLRTNLQPVRETGHLHEVGTRHLMSRPINGGLVGIRFNGWRKPVTLNGPGEDITEELKHIGITNLDIIPKEWEKATDTVDIVLRMLFSEVAKLTPQYRLRIEKFVRQGSAREGLKVCAADEFDSLLLFTIDELKYEVQNETDIWGRMNPEYGKLRVVHPKEKLEHCYPELFSRNAFSYHKDEVYLNSRMLHERVFTAIIDRAMGNVKALIDTSPHKYRFKITRISNPPSIQLGLSFQYDDSFDVTDSLRNIYSNYIDQPSCILVNEAAKIYQMDVDIVPALLIQNDRVPDPAKFNGFMDCPRYAVFKWARDTHTIVQDNIRVVETDAIWRMDSSGYEKHVLDVAQGYEKQMYFLTALRVLKAVFLLEKRKCPPIQTVTVLRSYFLKQLAFYCMLYYTVLQPYPLSGVREALTILLEFLQICLEEQRLPHFFHANTWLSYMFPDYNENTDTTDMTRFDVFHAISPEALHQAKIDLRRHVLPLLKEFTCVLSSCAHQIADTFRTFICEDNY